MLADTGWVSSPILFERFNWRRVVFQRILWGSEAKQKFSVVWKNFGECIEVCVRDTFRNTFSIRTLLSGMECFSWWSFSRNTHFVCEVQWKMSGFTKNTPRILVRKYFGEYFEEIFKENFYHQHPFVWDGVFFLRKLFPEYPFCLWGSIEDEWVYREYSENTCQEIL